MSSLGQELNKATLENLFDALSRIYTPNNLLVLARDLSKTINYLTTFLNLKERGKIDKTIFLEDLVDSEQFENIIQGYSSTLVIVQDKEADLDNFKKLWVLTKRHWNIKINLIVKDLSRSFYYELSSRVLGISTNGLLEKTTKVDLDQPVLRVSGNCRLLPWKSFPMCIEDFVFSTDMPFGGLKLYYDNPIEQISGLSDAVVKIMGHTTTIPEIMKLKNAFAKGDHASLLLNTILDDKMPAMLSAELSANEQQFYIEKLRGNTDIVVVERNLDYFPLLLTQLNYLGLLDDLYGTEDEFHGTLRNKEKLNDELYANLKHLNFASIGVKLNKLARYLQQEYGNKDKLTDLQEIKQLVQNLGSLSTKQELVRKHTALSEGILDKLAHDKNGETCYNMREQWFELQNELFDLDYKLQIAKLNQVLYQASSFPIVISLVSLISFINDGIRQKDIESIERDVQLNFGMDATLSLQKFLDRKLIKVNTRGNDFFGTFTFGKTEIETTTTSTATTGAKADSHDDRSYEDTNFIGVTGGQDVFKSTYTLISKFWNLHPIEEDGELVIETVDDYPLPSFTLPSGTVPLITRLVEALYSRRFLKYKPVTSVSRRPNWESLNLDTMLKGQTIDKNICDELDKRKSLTADNDRKEFLILVFVGGITRSEISVLEYLRVKTGKTLIVVTSGIVNKEKLLASTA